MARKVFNIPNMLCLYRVAVIPVMAWLFTIDTASAAWTNVFLFTLAGLTDFLDGIIARALNQTTLLGKFLDSSTDKMLIGVTLFMLVAFDRIDGFWTVMAVIIFLREIFISGVREFMALYNVSIGVSQLAKWKTTIQMLAIGFLIAGPYGEMLIPYAPEIGRGIFLIATVITVMSGWDYARQAWKNIQRIESEKKL
jgi:cardiolipin synthase